MKYFCDSCNLSCRSKVAYEAHIKAKHNLDPKPKEVEEMEEKDIREIVADVVDTREQLRESREKIKELEQKHQEEIKALENEKETEVSKVKTELNQIRSTLPTRELGHPEMFEKLISCPECRGKVEEKIIEKLHESNRLGEVIKNVVCDGLGCKVLKCKDDNCRWEFIQTAEVDEDKGKGGFTLGQASE